MNYWQSLLDLSQAVFFPQILNIVNVVLILLTVLVTYLSWHTAKRANELQLLPLLAVYFRGKALKDRTIRIRNIGKSPAYDIKIESYLNIIKDIQHVWRLDLSLSGTNVLVPDEEKDLKMRATDNGKEADMSEFMVFHLDPEEEHKRERVGLLLTFRNAEGNYYYSEVETGAGGLFIKPARKYNLWGKAYVGYRQYSEKVLLKLYEFKWKFTKPYIKQPKKA
jgi:hypothetical protein